MLIQSLKASRINNAVCLTILIMSIGLLTILIQKGFLNIKFGYDGISDLNDMPRKQGVRKLFQRPQVKHGKMFARNSSGFCKQPTMLPLNPPEIQKHIYTVPPIDCSREVSHFVKCDNLYCFVDQDFQLYNENRLKRVHCRFQEFFPFEPYSKEGTKLRIFEIGLAQSDLVKVECLQEPKPPWRKMLTVFRNTIYTRESSWARVPKNCMQLNVILLVVHAVSANHFKRKLPKSYKYLKKLESVFLQGYNVISGGTMEALIPLLTGETESELQDVNSPDGSTTIDSYPFIWKTFSDAGYVTGYYEDGLNSYFDKYFNKDFKNCPTDHYIKASFLMFPEDEKDYERGCIQDKSHQMIMFDYIVEFFRVYKAKPKFMFASLNELPEDNFNRIGVTDVDLLDFLQKLKTTNILNDTVLITVSTHGTGFADIHDTLLGKLEERLPFASITLPPRFKHNFRAAHQNMKINAKRLTTAFDVHATMLNILDYNALDIGRLDDRGISLFTEVPLERNCLHVGIKPQWCTCLEWEYISSQDPLALRLVDTIITYINKVTEKQRELCELLSLQRINWIARLIPNTHLTEFQQGVNEDGKAKFFQVEFTLQPGELIFEAPATYYLASDHFEVNFEELIRLNEYGMRADCIYYDYPSLRKYCYCKENI